MSRPWSPRKRPTRSPVKLEQLARQAEALFERQHIEDARFELELLLMHVLGVERAQLFARWGSAVSPEAAGLLWRLVDRRLSHEPSAYILNRREFYGLEFYVDERVLVPRPETELLVDETIAFDAARPASTVADVGTGSGNLAVALAAHLPQAVIYAGDISAGALEVAGINCRRHGVAGRVRLLLGNLLEPFPAQLDVIVANLPYIRDDEMAGLMPEVRREPATALRGGESGLELIEALLEQMPARLAPEGLALLEVGLGQAGPAAAAARRCFPKADIRSLADLAGIDRVVRILT